MYDYQPLTVCLERLTETLHISMQFHFGNIFIDSQALNPCLLIIPSVFIRLVCVWGTLDCIVQAVPFEAFGTFSITSSLS